MKKNEPATDNGQLISGGQLLVRLFSPRDRPSQRTLIRWRQAGRIPFTRIGRAVWYDEAKVREAIERKNLVRAV